MINSYNVNNHRYACIVNTCNQLFDNSNDCLGSCKTQKMSPYIRK